MTIPIKRRTRQPRFKAPRLEKTFPRPNPLLFTSGACSSSSGSTNAGDKSLPHCRMSGGNENYNNPSVKIPSATRKATNLIIEQWTLRACPCCVGSLRLLEIERLSQLKQLRKVDSHTSVRLVAELSILRMTAG